MKTCSRIALAGMLAIAAFWVFAAAVAQESSWTESTLKFQPAAKGDFPYFTMREEQVGELCHDRNEYYVPIPVKKKLGVMGTSDTKILTLDCDHDYKEETKISGQGGLATAKLIYEDDTVSTYTMKIIRGAGTSGVSWQFLRHCWMAGKVANLPFALIDDSNNGKYDDYGQDSFVVGDSKYATPLGKVASLGGQLFNLEAKEHGTSVKTKPYEGKTGYLDMSSQYKCVGKLMVAIVQCGQNFFDASGKDPLLVPVGSYSFLWGVISNGKQSAVIQPGKMVAIEVKEGETTKVAWGMPVRLEIDAVVSAGMLRIGPANVKAFGTANEEYVTFKPRPLLPQLEVQGSTGSTIGRGAVAEATDGC
ncbi:MAG: hypothetical protein RDV41_03030 [Planctomycetota bacterium]|nr:hypothetical protein [Planctomycetota bacterium]